MKKLKLDYKKYVSWIILLALVVLFSIASDRFSTIGNAITVLRQVSINGIMAVGLSFILISGGIDLSLGPMLGFTGTLTAMLIVGRDWPLPIACITAIAATALFGVFNGVSIMFTNMPPLISTLGMSYVIKGVAYLLNGGMPVYNLPKAMQFIGQGYLGPIPIPVILFVIIAVIGSFVLNKTTYGRSVYAMGSNGEAARLAGINIKKIQVAVYSVAGLLAGFSGIIMMSRLNAGQPGTGNDTSMDIIIASVLGGVSISGGEGSIIGLIGGLLTMGVLSNGMTILGLNNYYQLVMKGVVLVLAVAVDYYARTKMAKKRHKSFTVRRNQGEKK
jgi:ribose/xylose/arabinose/galactoside ABC-type transport system permease subunit